MVIEIPGNIFIVVYFYAIIICQLEITFTSVFSGLNLIYHFFVQFFNFSSSFLKHIYFMS